MLKLTREQKHALREVFRRDWERPTVDCPACGGDGGNYDTWFETASFSVADRHNCERCKSTGNVDSYLAFRRTVVPMFGAVVAVPYCGMILGIEPDGYTHS